MVNVRSCHEKPESRRHLMDSVTTRSQISVTAVWTKLIFSTSAILRLQAYHVAYGILSTGSQFVMSCCIGSLSLSLNRELVIFFKGWMNSFFVWLCFGVVHRHLKSSPIYISILMFNYNIYIYMKNNKLEILCTNTIFNPFVLRFCCYFEFVKIGDDLSTFQPNFSTSSLN